MSTITSPSKQERILIAVDGSAPSDWAVQTGRQFAEQLGARVRLVHVTEPMVPAFVDLLTAEEIDKRRTQYGLGLLKQTRLSFPARVEVDIILRSGLQYEEITAEAKAWKATLIVLGTRGRNRLAGLVLGSTAEAVLRKSPCPVIVVGHPLCAAIARAPSSVEADTEHAAVAS